MSVDTPTPDFEFSDTVQQAIATVFTPDELTVFDMPDFTVASYVDTLDVNDDNIEEALGDVILDLERQLTASEADLRFALKEYQNLPPPPSLESVASGVDALQAEVREIALEASSTLKDVSAVSSDLARLDTAKENISSAVAVLSQLSSFMTAIDMLEASTTRSDFSSAAAAAASAVTLLNHFNTNCSALPRLVDLGKRYDSCRDRLLDAARILYRQARSDDHFVDMDKLEGALLAVEAMGEQDEFVSWAISLEIAESTRRFDPELGTAESGLDRAEARCRWCRTRLTRFGEIAPYVPKAWNLVPKFIVAWQNQVVEHLGVLVLKAAENLPLPGSDVTEADASHIRDILHPVSLLAAFERRLEEMYGEGFAGRIATAFEPALPSFVALQSQTFKNLVVEAANARKEDLRAALTAYKTTDAPALGAPLPSAEKLCATLLRSVTECARLSGRQALYDIHRSHRDVISGYISNVLLAHLPAACRSPPPELGTRPGAMLAARPVPIGKLACVETEVECAVVLATVTMLRSQVSALAEATENLLHSEYKEGVDFTGCGGELDSARDAAHGAIVASVAGRLATALTYKSTDGDDSGAALAAASTAGGLIDDAVVISLPVSHLNNVVAICHSVVLACGHAILSTILKRTRVQRSTLECAEAQIKSIKRTLSDLPSRAGQVATPLSASDEVALLTFMKKVFEDVAVFISMLKSAPQTAEAVESAFTSYLPGAGRPAFDLILPCTLLKKSDHAAAVALVPRNRSTSNVAVGRLSGLVKHLGRRSKDHAE